MQKAVYDYSALVAVKKGLDRIQFITEDGRTESCVVSRKNIHEAFLYIEKAVQPYIEERKRRLMAEGIRYSLVVGMGLTGGILNLRDDRAEFRSKSGQVEIVCYQDVRALGRSAGILEFALTNGASRSYTVDREIWEEVLDFVEQAIAPHVEKRTVGFDTSFGIDERIEINEERGVFHFIRQGGSVISEEYAMEDMVSQCFIMTATWGLERWEKIFGVSASPSLSYEQRREVLVAKLRGQGTTTVQMIRDVAAAFSGGEVEVTEDNPNHRFIVSFTSTKGIPENMQGFISMLEEIKPAHLAYEFKYWLTTWDELKNFNWNGLKVTTWDGIKTMEAK